MEKSLEDQAKKGNDATDELRALIDKERDERTKEANDMDNYFRYASDIYPSEKSRSLNF